MTHHRPHPLTGPWPYTKANTPASEAGDRLVDRVPTADSVVYDDPEDAILFDGCPRCEEHATYPLADLDAANTAALWAEMVRVERDPTMVAGYRTHAEAKACRHLYRIAVWIERHVPTVNPWVWPWQGQLTVDVDGVEVIL